MHCFSEKLPAADNLAFTSRECWHFEWKEKTFPPQIQRAGLITVYLSLVSLLGAIPGTMLALVDPIFFGLGRTSRWMCFIRLKDAMQYSPQRKRK